MPDFFEGRPADITWYPPTTPEQTENLTTFFSTQAVPSKTLDKIPGVVSAANNPRPFAKWAIVGHCWGGKIASLSAATPNPIFRAAVQCHPAMFDPADATQVTIPMALLASGDEPVDDMAAYQKSLQVPCHVETFSTQIHGWMAARSNLEDAEVRKEYERGYNTV